MNIFNYWSNGDWENANSNVESDGFYTLQKSSEQAFQGSFSGKVKLIADDNFGFSRLSLTIVNNNPPFPGTSPPRIRSFVFGREYTIKIKFYVPTVNPVGTDDVQIGIGVSGLVNNLPTLTTQRIGDIKGGWHEITVSHVINNSDFQSAVFFVIVHTQLGGSINLNGDFFIDGIELTETIPCDIAFGSPSFTKTNESVVAGNNGTITVNATSSWTLEYSIDNINWQLSNSFTALPPNTYSVYIRDTNPLGCGVLQVDDIIISPADPIIPPPPLGGDLIIDLKPINDVNFLTWFSANGNIGFEDIKCINKYWDIPNAYLNNKASHKHYPIITPDELTSFYINFTDNQNDPNHADFRLSIIDRSGVVSTDVSPLSIAFHDDGVRYDIHSNVDIPVIFEGIYRFIIYNVTSNDVLFISQEVELLTNDYKSVSTRIQFKNSLNLYGFRYEQIPDFVQQFRMRLYKIDEQTEGDTEQYRSVSSGRLRNVHYELDRYIILESYYFDKLGHRAMSAFQVHDVLLVNEVKYLTKSNYEITTNQLLDINKGTLELYEQEFSTANRFGSIGGLIIVGSDDDLLLGDNGGFIKL